MASLITTAATQADSADIVLGASTSTTLSLRPANGGVLQPDAVALVSIKSSGGDYTVIGAMTYSKPLTVLTAQGTFRVTRMAAGTAFGVDRD